MAIKNIILDSNKLIREKSEEVKQIDEEIRNIIIDMDDTLEDSGGLGISAVQIGILKRIILVKYENEKYIVINPKIVNSIDNEIGLEGCLSVIEEDFPYIYGKVERAFVIEVTGLDEEGNNVNIIADGMLARIFQHEIDHLDGIIYTDKIIGELKKSKLEESLQEERKMVSKKGKVLLGMSGGVDSSVAAILLKSKGYEVIGATMKLWEDGCDTDDEGGCGSSCAVYDAKRVCNQIEIPHHTLNSQEDFKKYVIDDFINCYKCAKTPNPCIECNRYLKFGTFYRKALELDCDYVSTGHYAKIEFSDKYNQYVMRKSESYKKDQTYFLYNIPKEILPKMIFPLDKFNDKSDVRKIANAHKLKVADKKDSQEVCFIPDNNYGGFLQRNLDEKPKNGNIVLENGTIVGNHKGLIYYTIGQRKGLGIAYKNPLYVIRLDTKKNEVVVGEEKDLYKRELEATGCNFLLDIDLANPIEVMAKIRYRAKEAKAILTLKDNESIIIEFEEPQRAITPGQSVVFYIDDVVLGGGKII